MFLKLIFILSSLTADAYIPNSDFIIQKTAKNHGKGLYRIEQEITFPFGNDQKVIRETWYTLDGNSFYLLAKGRGFHLERLYTNGKSYAKTSSGELKQTQWSDEFSEPWFLTTSTNKIKTLIKSAKIADASALRWDPVKSLKEVTSMDSMPIRLSRNRGIVMYAYGTPTPKDSDSLNPTLWIEQDKFVIRRLRFSSAAEVIADEYGEYTRDLKYPKTRLFNWGEFSVPVRVIQVSALNKNSKRGKEVLSYAAFVKSQENKTLVEENLVNNSIREFYARFR